MNLTPQTPPHPSGDKRFKLLDAAIALPVSARTP